MITKNIKNKVKSKKAQIAGQVFIFILAAGLALLIIGYGYQAIHSFVGRTEEISLINFKTDLQSEIRTIASDYGSVKRVDLQIPGSFDMLCLVDTNYQNKQSACLCNRGACPTGRENEYQPEICDAWTTSGNQDNVFLVPITPIRASSLKLDNSEGYLCVFPRGTKVSLRLEGKGDHTLVSEWPIG